VQKIVIVLRVRKPVDCHAAFQLNITYNIMSAIQNIGFECEYRFIYIEEVNHIQNEEGAGQQ